jgi:hypothetical protein
MVCSNIFGTCSGPNAIHDYSKHVAHSIIVVCMEEWCDGQNYDISTKHYDQTLYTLVTSPDLVSVSGLFHEDVE